MAKGFYKQISRILKELGFVKEKNGKGSHEKWFHPDKPGKLTVPRNMYSRHTANGILKDVGSDKKL